MNVRDHEIPDLVYGTAWKEAATTSCVTAALAAGFRAIDTANQRKHYFEEGVGDAIRASGIARDALWLQTKFTHLAGQDARLPYDAAAPIAEQVKQSFASSLVHLGVDRLDSYVLHGPSARDQLTREDVDAWRAMEAIAEAGQVTFLGISNVNARQLGQLLELARVEPAFVQNRCYAERVWDGEMRDACAAAGIVYQGFSLLTANRQVVQSPAVAAIGAKHGATPAQVVFRACLASGMLPLTGTTDPQHMREDLAACALPLSPDDVRAILNAR